MSDLTDQYNAFAAEFGTKEQDILAGLEVFQEKAPQITGVVKLG